jgi:hypothetical protein
LGRPGATGGSASQRPGSREPVAARPRDAGSSQPTPTPTVSEELTLEPIVEETVSGARASSRGWSRWHHRPSWLVIALAASVLVVSVQAFWFQFDRWSLNPSIRPYYERVCGLLRCELPVLRALDAITSRNLVVRSHAGNPDLLQVDAVIINEAAFPQPFPTIELRFSAMGGQLISGQRIRPDEYLGGELAGARMMPPMTPVRIRLEVMDPGADAVNYVMVFR